MMKTHTYSQKRYAIMVVLLTGLAFTSCTTATDNWEPLFDGETLNGWKRVGGEAPYAIEDGAIVGTMTSGTPNSFLVTEKEYGDFILELEVKLEGEATNSGIQTRSHLDEAANDGRGRVYGRQVEIDPGTRAWTGGIYDEARRGWLYPLDLNEEAKAAYKKEEYNHIRIEAIGNETKTWINGIPTAYVVDTLDATGFIGLQVHSIGDEALAGKKVYFKNIRIQTENLKQQDFPLGIYVVNLTPNSLTAYEQQSGYQLLFDGHSNAGWVGAYKDAFPAKGWEIKDGIISVLPADGGESTNGGDIVTTEQYGAFDFSFEFKLTEGGNSGVKYFVTLDEHNTGSAIGLEYQVLDDERHPDAKMGKDGNRTLASLYDLIVAQKTNRSLRKIGEWNKGRIVVQPDNIVTHYLNGEKVLQYERGSDAYKKLVSDSKYKNWDNFGQAAQGHLLLQDHGDRVSFRNLKIKSL
ncbi:3-keto-disaccharide hydrolase [Parapedobacter pyrenivorans]|uniref:3-keto-disaccharide hydrolase n=1 Tax=Parapedobacter pyrenivorans TaxID=1305674 RepID=UPI00333EAFE0